jgi:hypothetical protein
MVDASVNLHLSRMSYVKQLVGESRSRAKVSSREEMIYCVEVLEEFKYKQK